MAWLNDPERPGGPQATWHRKGQAADAYSDLFLYVIPPNEGSDSDMPQQYRLMHRQVDHLHGQHRRGLMLGQFTRWLRQLPLDADVTLNLLSMELSAMPSATLAAPWLKSR